MSQIEKVAVLLECNNFDDFYVIQELNSIINQLDNREQMNLFSELSTEAINRIYPLLDKIAIHNHTREHITWTYYKQRIHGLSSLSSDIFQDILNVYLIFKFLALESLVIEMLKTDILSLTQVKIAEKVFLSKAFSKESVAFKYRDMIRSGKKLNSEDVLELLQLRAYTTLDFAIEKNAITTDGLNQIVEPVEKEKDRKTRMALFQKANSHKS
jgi:hypothetical protein